MRYGLNNDVVKRIAALSFHKKGSMMQNISHHFHNINQPEVINNILNAHTSDSMNNKFKDKEDENKFKVYLAKTAAINRGTLEPVNVDTPAPKGKLGKTKG